MRNNYIAIALSIFMVSCSSTSKSNNDYLMGKWEITSVEEVTDSKLEGYLIDNLSFFGIGVWAQSNSKYLIFMKDGGVKSNIVDNEKLDKIKFSYRLNDNMIEFYGVNPHIDSNDSELLFFAVYSKLNNKQIKIVLDGVLTVSLEKK